MRPDGRWIAALALCLATVAAAPCAGPAGGKALSGAEQTLFKIWTEQLSDAARSAKTKIEAAEGLLTRTYPQAAEALTEFLEKDANRPAQIAVAEAVARQGGGADSFIDPLMAMLTGGEPSVRAPAARALATYKDLGVPDRLVTVALDRKKDRAVRLACLIALERMLDKKAVDGLVRLLDDHDLTVRKAAAESLAHMTNVRAMDRMEWKRWWRKNKNKGREEWLADLTESLAQRKLELEAENARLRKQLASTMRELYAATPSVRQDSLLRRILNDPLADVRLVGADLVDRRIAENAPVSPEVRGEIRSMLSDEAAEVRQAAATVVAHLGDADSLKVLLARLDLEQVPETAAAVLKALGQLRDPQALPAVLKHIGAAEEVVAAAAAGALARIALAKPLEGPMLARASKALLDEYAAIAGGTNSLLVREALLTAMGVLGNKDFIPSMTQALGDSQARVRQAAVHALARLGLEELGDLLEPYAADKDYGVRQATVEALGVLGGTRHLKVILQRTDPDAEPQASVRSQAWDVAMSVLAEADLAPLAEALEILAPRKDSPDRKVRVHELYVEKLRAARDPGLSAAEYELAKALLANARPAEAARHLQEVHRHCVASKSPKTIEVWRMWVQALLRANDPAGIDAMAAQTAAEPVAQATAILRERIAQLREAKDFDALIPLAERAVNVLAKRLAAADLKALQTDLAEARSAQLAADRKRVSDLAARLLGADDNARRAAAAELAAMGNRAIGPMLEELRKAVAAKPPAPKAEQTLLAALQQLAPDLTGYDPAAPKDQKLKVIDAWKKGL